MVQDQEANKYRPKQPKNLKGWLKRPPASEGVAGCVVALGQSALYPVDVTVKLPEVTRSAPRKVTTFTLFAHKGCSRPPLEAML
jgi:hypothetical protein